MAVGENGETETSLREDLEASLKEIEARETDAPAEVAPEPNEPVDSEPVADTGRDEKGRFRAKEAELATPEAPTEPVQAEAVQVEAAPADPLAKPPQSWRADEAEGWAALPDAARKAIIRREESVAKIVGAQDGERMFGREMADIVRPHMQTIEQFGVTPQFALKTLLANDNTMRTGTIEQKVAMARRMLTDYGLDPAYFAQPDPNMPSDPHVYGLQQQIAQLEARLNAPADQSQFSPLPQAQEELNIAQTIQEFRSDPAHPHFDAVQPVMARLLETEAATDLSEAYHMAVASNPALRSTPVEAQRTQQDKTLAARRASASVTGSPGATGNPAPTTLREELQEQLRAHGFTT